MTVTKEELYAALQAHVAEAREMRGGLANPGLADWLGEEEPIEFMETILRTYPIHNAARSLFSFGFSLGAAVAEARAVNGFHCDPK